MSAIEAYKLVLKYAYEGYSTDTCTEYKDFYMFPYGGSSVLCVDKRTGKVYESSRWRMPKEDWIFVDLV